MPPGGKKGAGDLPARPSTAVAQRAGRVPGALRDKLPESFEQRLGIREAIADGQPTEEIGLEIRELLEHVEFIERLAVEPGITPTSYTTRLLGDRSLRLKKIGEEAAELVLACADGDAGAATQEAADLFYHTLVALRAVGVPHHDVELVLSDRQSNRSATM